MNAQVTLVKGLDKQSVLRYLADGKVHLPPLDIQVLPEQAQGGDAALRLSWGGRTQHFSAFYSFYSTPKAFGELIARARLVSSDDASPLVITPFLTYEQLQQLEQEGVSGLDLSGNGVIIARDFLLFRSGQPSLIPLPKSEIKNVFTGDSALIARCFLLRAAFSSATELQAFASARFKMRPDAALNVLTDSTVSKVVKALEEEMIISRTAGRLQLSDGKRLMRRLLDNYSPKKVQPVEGKTPLSPEEVWRTLASVSMEQPIRCNATGSGSAAYYNVLSSGGKLSIYVDDTTAAMEALRLTPTKAFPNLTIVQTTVSSFYFDQRADPDTGAVWASPVQTWLELMRGDAREQSAARELETALEQGKGERLP